MLLGGRSRCSGPDWGSCLCRLQECLRSVSWWVLLPTTSSWCYAV